MRHLALIALLALAGCSKPGPELETSTGGGRTGGGGSGGGGGSRGDGGADAGFDAGSELVACDPRDNPSTCPAPKYCACAEPQDAGSCYCFSGEQGDPCPAGAAVCQAPWSCRWSSGFWWGKCGTLPAGACGDVCELGSAFVCDSPCDCRDGCKWGRCCM